jgi:hypothetical protein
MCRRFFFYYGVATFADTDWKTLRVPNEMVRASLYTPQSVVVEPKIEQFLEAPTADTLKALTIEVYHSDSPIENEATFQYRVASVFSRFCHNRDITLELITVDRIRLDLVVVQDDVAIILELKHIARENLNFDANNDVLLDGNNQPLDSLQALHDDELMLLFSNAQTHSHMPRSLRKGGHIVLAAQLQAEEQEQKLRQSGRFGISATSVVHTFVVVLVDDAVIVRVANAHVTPNNEKRGRQAKRSRLKE